MCGKCTIFSISISIYLVKAYQYRHNIENYKTKQKSKQKQKQKRKQNRLTLKKRGLRSNFYVVQEGNFSAPSINECILPSTLKLLGCWPKTTSKIFRQVDRKNRCIRYWCHQISFHGGICKLGILSKNEIHLLPSLDKMGISDHIGWYPDVYPFL